MARNKKTNSSAASSETTSSRPDTYLKNQGDHVTAYGLINSAVGYLTDKMMSIEDEIRQLKLNSSKELDRKKDQKKFFRNELFKLLKVTLILNEIVSKNSSDDQEQSGAILSSSTRQDESADDQVETQKTPEANRKRATNLDKATKSIEEALEEYERKRENFLKNKRNANDLLNLLKNQTAKDLLPEDSSLRDPIGSDNFIRDTIENQENVFKENKAKMIQSISRSILSNFNNIPGITYENNPKNNPEDLIASRSYYDFLHRDQIELKDKAVDDTMGEARLVKDSLTFFSGIRNSIDSKNQSKNSNRESSRYSDPTSMVDKKILNCHIHNIFFYPKEDGGQSSDDAVQISKKDISKRENSIDELQNHMARHIFLLTVCYPFLANNQLKTLSDLGDVKTITIDEIIESFVKKNLEQPTDSKLEAMTQKVKAIYEGLHKELETYQNMFELDTTPSTEEERSSVSNSIGGTKALPIQPVRLLEFHNDEEIEKELEAGDEKEGEEEVRSADNQSQARSSTPIILANLYDNDSTPIQTREAENPPTVIQGKNKRSFGDDISNAEFTSRENPESSPHKKPKSLRASRLDQNSRQQRKNK